MSESASDGFDRELIAQHLTVLGRAGAERVVAAFRASLADRRAELAAAVADGDLDRVRRVGHAVKGLAASAGAVALARAGEAVQHADDDRIVELVADLEDRADTAASGIAAAWS